MREIKEKLPHLMGYQELVEEGLERALDVEWVRVILLDFIQENKNRMRSVLGGITHPDLLWENDLTRRNLALALAAHWLEEKSSEDV